MGKAWANVMLLSLSGCAHLPSRPASRCLAAHSSSTPRWVRVLGGPGDQSGRAELALDGGTLIKGAWRRTAPDSLFVSAAGPFDAVWLRLRIHGDSAEGDVEHRTDAEMSEAMVPSRRWTAVNGSCSQG